MIRIIFLIALVLLVACHPAKEKPAIKNANINAVLYGEDGRKDHYEMHDKKFIQLARSTVALIDRNELAESNDNFEFKDMPEINFCPSEKFIQQSNSAFCSGTLIAPDLILTAGHCMNKMADCESVRFVFDYAVTNATIKSPRVAKTNVYSCLEVIHSKYEVGKADFAIVRLNRAVMDRAPLKLANSEPKMSDQLFAIGHPMGVPTKFTFGGKVRSVAPSEYFVATIDTFSGNSGAAIFDEKTHLIMGVLSRGEQDFDRIDGCYIAKQCAESECRGEDITRATHIQKFLPQ